ncbi:hypothetical protein GIB67_015510 [Kingdonia uniflora]|uniref:Uncharacterized protein n=1 Tax=Kingdonia uniflora TaxID=39325 RepID=A0A7J7LAB9_9MAGN|nr:hypothetical protein GIB67_015510 [Kingdonia uniflora]
MFLVGSVAGNRRRQQAVIVGKEIREALVRMKWLCREGIVSDGDVLLDKEMVESLRNLRRLLSKSGIPPVEAAIKASTVKGGGKAAFHLDHQRNRMFSWQLLTAVWCLKNIAAGEPEQTKALIPALPMLIAYIGAVFKQHFAYIWRYLPSPVKSKVAS